MAARLLSLSFGPIQQAVTKVAAISLIPAAVGGMISELIKGGGGNMVGWAISLLLVYGLFMFFFELDLNETMMCTAIIWLVRTWIGLFITIMILRGIGGAVFNTLSSPGFGFGDDPAMVADDEGDEDEDAAPAKKPPRASGKKPATPAAQDQGAEKSAAKPEANADEDPDEDDPDAEE
jgi:hypothetical protein